jgi:mitogen-activated protein kinase kinase kinase
MAMLAAKPAYSAPPLASSSSQTSSQYSASVSSYRNQGAASRADQSLYASPTESDFSEVYDAPDAVRHWDEDKVGDWLKRINCAQYADLFRRT